MTRLDQLSQPTRRKGEHIRAVIERERQQQIESNLEAERVATARKMSRSLTHLSSSSSARSPAPLRLYQPSSASKANTGNNHVRPLRKSNATKSMTQLVTAKLLSTPKTTPTVVQARIAQKHANDTEIDSRTTNVSAGVCSPFPFLTLVPTKITKKNGSMYRLLLLISLRSITKTNHNITLYR